jgi:hypothetical protein
MYIFVSERDSVRCVCVFVCITCAGGSVSLYIYISRRVCGYVYKMWVYNVSQLWLLLFMQTD